MDMVVYASSLDKAGIAALMGGMSERVRTHAIWRRSTAVVRACFLCSSVMIGKLLRHSLTRVEADSRPTLHKCPFRLPILVDAFLGADYALENISLRQVARRYLKNLSDAGQNCFESSFRACHRYSGEIHIFWRYPYP